MSDAAPAGGRVARRRAQARARILEAAEQLILERGVESVTIDEIAEASDIARRSFYSHFESKHDILVPIARERTRRIHERIDRLVKGIDDPAAVLATAFRHAIRALTRDPLCRWLLVHSHLPQSRLLEGLGESGLRDIRRGVEVGRFQIANSEAMRLVLTGSFVSVLIARAEGALDDRTLDDAVELLLRMLGVGHEDAARVTHGKLPPLPPARRKRT